MWDGYVSTAKEVFPNAEIVIDRFHFFGQMNKALDHVRKQLRGQSPINNALKGMVEGINNKIKRIKRMAFGFRNFNNFD